MKIGILADVHANLEALTAVLEDLDRRFVDETWFLGDAVGYGADPAGCLDRVATRACRMVLGNHDHAAAKEEADLEGFHEDAAAAIRWTRGVLPRGEKERLQAMGLECVGKGVHLVHGSPCKPERWEYVISEGDAERGFAASSSRWILVGHSHIPAAYVELECKRLFTGVFRRVQAADPGSLRLEPRYRYILNPGSVGQPRDGDPRASYAILEPESGTYRVFRVAYDVERASEKIRRAGLPKGLAERLESGI